MAKAPRSTLCIPCVYALLPDKSKATYLILFNKLKELDMSGPTVAHMDYETAVYYSMKKIFPQTKLVGCDTHWKRNLRKNQTEVGLIKFVNRELAVQTWTRMLWAISYVPPRTWWTCSSLLLRRCLLSILITWRAVMKRMRLTSCLRLWSLISSISPLHT